MPASFVDGLGWWGKDIHVSCYELKQRIGEGSEEWNGFAGRDGWSHGGNHRITPALLLRVWLSFECHTWQALWRGSEVISISTPQDGKEWLFLLPVRGIIVAWNANCSQPWRRRMLINIVTSRSRDLSKNPDGRCRVPCTMS